MDIRRAEVDDAASMLPLIEQYRAFEGVPGCDAEALRVHLERLLSSPALGVAWIALDAERPVGYLILVFVFSLEHLGLTAEVDECFVAPGRRSTGLGSRMLAEAEHEAARHGCTNLSLQIGASNRRARAFYARHGFVDRPAFDLLEKDLRSR